MPILGTAPILTQGRKMLYFDKQPSGKPFDQILSSLRKENGEEPEPRLGNPPTKREISLIEKLFAFDGPPDATVSVGGEEYYYFSGGGYLGLQAHPEVLAATCEAVLHYGISSGSLRRRYTPVPVLEVQRQAAEIFGTQRALYCTGDSDALGCLLESVISSYDLVLIDEHCSDATLSITRRILARSAARLASFKHRNADDLKRVLVRKTKNRYKHPLIITDGVFNVTGEIAPIPEYYNVLSAFPGAALLIDDSDAFGVLGAKGRGTLEYFGYDSSRVNLTQQDEHSDPTYGIAGLSYDDSFSEPDFFEKNIFDGGEPWSGEEDAEGDGEEDDFIYSERDKTAEEAKKSVPIYTYLVTSLARAIGGFGAIIPGSPSFLDRIQDLPRFQFSDYPPTPLAAATLKGLQLSFYRDDIRHKLWDNVYYFKSEMKKLGFAVQENMVPIVAIKTGSDQNMRRIQHKMIKEQILVSFLQKINSRHPEGNIRTALFASHERVMLDIFLDTLQRSM
jgi:7-keto-8-aminopelargonate synthetase-like enzyme